jgi:TRAP-type C4-dicarboxylate transport system permease small subunit
MRKLLHLAVNAAGLVACLLLVAMVVVMFAAIFLRQFGVLLSGHEEIATFAMVGMAFLGLPYAYQAGAHVRVETLLTRLPEAARARFNVWCVAVAFVICAAFAYFAFGLAQDSYVFGDVSEGLLAIPRWIPQLPVPIGLALLALTLLDDLVLLLRGEKASYEVPRNDDTALVE